MVLVVDDEEGIRVALRRFLTRQGYEVSTAADGFEALTRLREHEHHVMISDIRMPNMSGLELAPKALGLDPDLAIIMLSAVDEPRVAIDCLKQGAFDYLIKPVDLEELGLSVSSAVRRRELEIERRELERWLAGEVAQRTRDMSESTSASEELAIRSLIALVDVVEARDPAQAGLSRRVAALSTMLATKLGLSEDTIRQVQVAGHLHGLGRLVLSEPTLKEAVMMTDDPNDESAALVALERLLKPIHRAALVPLFIRASHEKTAAARTAGTPPDDRAIAGRVLATARLYADALARSGRRTAASGPEAVRALRPSVGTLIDPAVFEALEQVVAEGRTGTGDTGA